MRRILGLKARLGLHRNRHVDAGRLPFQVASRANLAQATLSYEKTVTLVKNEGDILPLQAGGAPRKTVVLSLSSDADDYYAGRAFVREVQKRLPDAAAFYADAYTGEEFMQEARAEGAGADELIIAVFSTLRTAKGSVGLLPRHIELIREMTESRKGRVVVLSFGSPYFLRHFPEASVYLCLYRGSVQAQETAAKAIFGEVDISGRLPVSIPGLFPIGHGIDLAKR